MKLRFTIARKLLLGFGILTLAFIINTILVFNTLHNSRKASNAITTIYNPSSEYLKQLYDMVNNSKLLIKNWVFIEQTPKTPDKEKLVLLQSNQFPALSEKLENISQQWGKEEKDEYRKIITGIRDTLFVYHKIVMESLNSFESYDDPMVMFEIQPMVEEQGEIMVITEDMLNRLTKLIAKQNDIVEQANLRMVQSFNNFQRTILIMGGIILLAVVIIAFITIRALVTPINRMKSVLLEMSIGKLPTNIAIKGNDEIAEMAIALNQLVGSLKQISDFAAEIGKGNLKSEFNALSNQDRLGNALLEMRNNLEKAFLMEQFRKIEDEHRSWATHGLAKFADILRKNNDNTDALAYDIISNLVKYVGANIGAIYTLTDENTSLPNLELKACYAYNRQKYLTKKIAIDIGLTGRCFREREIVYMNEVPDNYISITSGLGDEKPTTLLLVPMIMNDVVYGIIEIASFNNIDSYKSDFIKDLGEDIASTLATVKANMQTQLLLEKTRMQAEEMISKEEEMRQNMEELKATQEEYEKIEEELRSEIQTLRQKV